MRPNAQEVAEVCVAGARRAYESDGVVEPTVFLVGENSNGLIVHPHPRLSPDDPRLLYAEIVHRVGKLYPWRIIAMAAEGWSRTYAPDTDLSTLDVRRGDLERAEAAGDMAVRTAVMGTALDLGFPPGSCTRTSIASVGTDGKIEWEHLEFLGEPVGDLPEIVLHAYRTAPVPPDNLTQGLPPLPLLAAVLVEAELATAALLLTEFPTGL